MGQTITAIAVALDQFGAPIDKGPVTWSSSDPLNLTVFGKRRSD
jgi:hypothetical protein